MQLKYKYQENN